MSPQSATTRPFPTGTAPLSGPHRRRRPSPRLCLIRQGVCAGLCGPPLRPSTLCVPESLFGPEGTTGVGWRWDCPRPWVLATGVAGGQATGTWRTSRATGEHGEGPWGWSGRGGPHRRPGPTSSVSEGVLRSVTPASKGPSTRRRQPLSDSDSPTPEVPTSTPSPWRLYPRPFPVEESSQPPRTPNPVPPRPQLW